MDQVGRTKQYGHWLGLPTQWADDDLVKVERSH